MKSYHPNTEILLLLATLASLGVIVWVSWKVTFGKELFQLNLFCDYEIPVDHKVPMHLQWKTRIDTFWVHGQVRRRGGYTISHPKHSYELDLPGDLSLAGLPADDDWILHASYIDKTFLRHILAYDLFRAMNTDNRAAEYAFIRLLLNGNYHGLYILMQKIDPSSLRLIKQDTQAVIFKEPPLFRPDLTIFQPQRANNYHQQTYPTLAVSDKSYVLDSIRQFLLHAPNVGFQQGLLRWFDLPNLLDWHLLLLLTNNSDGLLKNFYLYRSGQHTPFRIAPWDYDHSLGRDGDGEYNFDRFIQMEKNILFRRLLQQKWYQAELFKRWKQHQKNNVLSLSGLKKRIQKLVSKIEAYVNENAARWPVDGPAYYDNQDFKSEIALLLRFLTMRHQQLVQEMEAMQ